MARIPYVEPEAASPEVRAILERLPVRLNIFKLMAHTETGFRPLVQLGAAILSQQQLSGALRELAILQVARLSPARYEWVQHVPIARGCGVREEQIEALEAGRTDADRFDDVERAVLAFTAELVQRARASDEAFAAVSRHLSPREIVELIVAIGFYMTMARLMETAEIDPDPPGGDRIVASLS